MEPKAPKANCSECPLRDARMVPSVFPSKQGKYHVGAIGEAPGKTELARHIPFIGPSGKMLNEVLKHYRVSRDELYLSNAMLCHYPDASDKKVLAEAAACCRPRLIHELKQANVDTVIALGATGAQSLLQTKENITNLRVGKPKVYENLTIIPTFHPAYCMRTQMAFPHMVTDVGKAFNLQSSSGLQRFGSEGIFFGTPNIVLRKEESFRTWTFKDNEATAIRIIKELYHRTDRYTVIDIETGVDKDEDSVHGTTSLLAFGICYARGRVVSLGRQALLSQKVRETLCDYLLTFPVTAQNGKFDIGELQALLGSKGNLLKLSRDTMLDSYSLNEGSGVHGLKYMAQEHLGADPWDIELKKELKSKEVKGDWAKVTPAILEEYNCYDCLWTRELQEYFDTKLAEEGLEVTPEVEKVTGVHTLPEFLIEASNMLMNGPEKNGMTIDIEYNRMLDEEYAKEIEKLDRQIEVNPRSPQQIQKWFRDAGIPIGSTDAETLLGIIDSGRYGDDVSEFCKKILGARKVSKLRGTYTQGIIKRIRPETGRVYSTFRLHGTTTGRLASRNPNLQNITRDNRIKRQYIASSSNLFIQADYSQVELRMLTWLAQDERMRALFNDETRDIFDELALDIYGRDYCMALSESQRKDNRTKVKTYAYGLSYGRTAHGIAEAFNMSLREAKESMNKFYALIPDIMNHQRDVCKRVLNLEDLVTPFGRHRRFYFINESNKEDVLKEAMAFKPQATASDTCVAAAIKLQKEGVDVRNLIHDAILAEHPEDEAPEVAKLMDKVMVSVAEDITSGYVKFATDCKIGKAWSDV